MVLTIEEIIKTQFDKAAQVAEETKKNADDKKVPNTDIGVVALLARKDRFDNPRPPAEAPINKAIPFKHTVDSMTRYQVKDKEYLTLSITTLARDTLDNKVYFSEKYGVLEVPEFNIVRTTEGGKRSEIERYNKEFFIPFTKEQVEALKDNVADSCKYYAKTDSSAYGHFVFKDWLTAEFADLEYTGRTPHTTVKIDKSVLEGNVLAARNTPSLEAAKVRKAKND